MVHVTDPYDARTCRMLEVGIKPCYVFDGKPPTMKGGELAKRKDKRDEVGGCTS